MRTPRRTKQKMFYATYEERKPVYEMDDAGNIRYVEVDGEQIPVESGEYKEGYSYATEFYNSITESLTEEEILAYGSQNKALAKMTYRVGEYPFKVGTLIWLHSAVETDNLGEVVETSADYKIVGIKDTGRLFRQAILRSNA